MQAEPSTTWNIGDVVLDLYQVSGRLGRGGFGEVYKVRHQGWNIDLAVKVPLPKVVAAAGGIESFEREAETWVNLGLHPHAVSCYYVQRLESTPLVFAEYVAGGSLQDWIRDRRLYTGGTTVSLKRILDIAIQFAWGLHYAHEQGLIHQDVKPANVMLTPEGVVKVTDFGLANARTVAAILNDHQEQGLREQRLANTTLMAAGSGAMTPAYCSPEQANREVLTRRSDLWSWGLSVLEIFQGGRTWLSGTLGAQALEHYLKTEPEDSQLPQIPESVAHLLRRCFRENPDERPRTMLDVANELQKIYQHLTDEAFPRQEPKVGKDTADSLNNRAVSLLDLGRQEEALQLWEQALKMQPQHPEASYNRSLILWRTGKIDVDTLVSDLEQMGQSRPKDWAAHYLLGRVHLERDDCKAAIKTLEAIQGVDAEREEVQRLLAIAKQRFFCLYWEQLSLQLEKNDCKAAIETLEAIQQVGTQMKEVRESKLLSVVKESLFTLHLKRFLLDFEGHFERFEYEAASQTLEAFQQVGAERTEIQQWLSISKESLFYLNLKLLLLKLPSDGRMGQVKAIYFNGADSIALSGSEDGTVKLWKVTTRLCLGTFKGHNNAVLTGCLSTDGRFALSGSWDETLKLWEVDTGSCLRTFKGHTNAVTSVCLSTDSRFALSGSADGTVKLWEVGTGRCLRTFKEKTESVNCVCLSADARFALSGNDDGTVKLWEVATGRCLGIFRGHRESVKSVCISGDGRFVLSGSDDCTVKLWEVGTGRCLRTIARYATGVTLTLLSADGYFALSGSGDGTVELWEVATGLCLDTFWSHINEVSSICLNTEGRLPWFGSNDNIQWSLKKTPIKHRRLSWCEWFGSSDEARKQWSLKETPIKNLVPSELYSILNNKHWALNAQAKKHLAPIMSSQILTSETARSNRETYEDKLEQARAAQDRGDMVAAAQHIRNARALPGYRRDLKAVNLWTHLYVYLPRTTYFGSSGYRLAEHKGLVSSVCLSGDSQFALSGSWDNTLKLWEVATDRCLKIFKEYTGAVKSVYLSRDSKFALSGNWDNTLKLWEVATGQYLRTFKGHTKSIASVCLSADGRFALSGSYDNTLKLWEIATARCLRTFEGHTGLVSSVCLSADGKFALSGSHDTTLKLWEVATGRCQHTFKGHTWFVQSVCLSADGKFALSGSHDKTLKLWEIATGFCVRTFEGHTDAVNSVCLSSDGKFALSGSRDKTLKLWEVATGRCLGSFGGHTDAVTSVCLSSDCRFAFSGSRDRTLNKWLLDWELEDRQPADWDEGARPYLENFLTLHTPYAATLPEDCEPSDDEITLALTHWGIPIWTEEDFKNLLHTLGCAGYGWLRSEGVRKQLETMAVIAAKSISW